MGAIFFYLEKGFKYGSFIGKTKIKKTTCRLKIEETLCRHLADKEPEEYNKVNGKMKVVKRSMAVLTYAKANKKKGR